MRRWHFFITVITPLAAAMLGCTTPATPCKLGAEDAHSATVPLLDRLSRPSREVAARELLAMGAYLDYALNILPDGTDPPKRIRGVRFPADACTDQALQYVAAFPELENLGLNQQPISDDGLQHISKLTGLRSLDLSGTRVTGAGIRHLLPLQQLESLYLEGQSLDENAFRQIARLEHLTTLRVDRTSLDDTRLILLTPLKELEYLGVFDTAVTADGAGRFNHVLPCVTVHRFKGQAFPDRPIATRPARVRDWSRDLVKQTFLWPHNFLSGSHWQGQGLDHREIISVLQLQLPEVTEENGEKPLFEVVATVTNRRIILIPAPSEEEKGPMPSYREAMSREAKPATVGELFRGIVTVMSEAGGPRGVSVVGGRKGTNDEEAHEEPYLIYSLYVTKEYIAIIALPADGG